MNAAVQPASAGSNNNRSTQKRKYHRGGGHSSSHTTTNNNNHNNKWQRPKRGGPGFLVTCEVGREHRARRDALDLLQYYCNQINANSKTNMVMVGADKDHVDDKNDDQHEKEPTAMLSLEDELKLLQSQSKRSTAEKNDQSSSNNNAPPFGVYDTGCRGTVVLLCTQENCRLIPSIRTEYTKAAKNNNNDSNDDDAKPTDKSDGKEITKRSRVENEKVEEEKNRSGASTAFNASQDPSAQRTPVWDPIDTFRQIYADWQAEGNCNTKTPSTNNDDDDDDDDDDDNENTTNNKVSARSMSVNRAAPSSRYITRMVPIQATCFASLEELRLMAQELLSRYFPHQTTATPATASDDASAQNKATTAPTTATFAVALKRRNCSTMSKDDIINTVAGIVLRLAPNSKVQLEEPDVTIVVEICQTLCGLSVVEKCHTFGNFNLAVLKEQN